MTAIDIIEKTRGILMQFPKINEICNEINVDFADKEPTSYGLTSTGDSLIKEDILGNQTRQHSFMLYSTFSGINDFERMSNSTVLTELSQWLSKRTGDEITASIDDEVHSGEILKITAVNGKLYEVPNGNIIVGLRYQLQIEVEYTIEF